MRIIQRVEIVGVRFNKISTSGVVFQKTMLRTSNQILLLYKINQVPFDDTFEDFRYCARERDRSIITGFGSWTFLKIGTVIAVFQPCGIIAVCITMLNRTERGYSKAKANFLKTTGGILSGPAAPLVLRLCIA